MKIAYIRKSFRARTQQVIETANQIIAEYEQQGLSLTLRQLYYIFVSRGLIPNKDTEYHNLGSIINDARLAGMISWRAIEDRTRNLRGLSHWEDPGSIVSAVAHSYRIDKWEGQRYRVEVWIEKDALVGVLERPCNDLQLDYFSCRGYTSASEVWAAARRLMSYARLGRAPVIIHLGDHDPSGIDMTRDITDRMRLFFEHDGLDAPKVERIALNMDQVRQYNPPTNPAKLTDARAAHYVQEYGEHSWELDALEPSVISQLVRSTVLKYRDEVRWERYQARENQERRELQKLSTHWEEVVEFLQTV